MSDDADPEATPSNRATVGSTVAQLADLETKETATLDGPKAVGGDDSFVLKDASRPRSSRTFDFGKYELLGELGRGGMGVVFKARQKGLERIVAIKMILANHLASPDQVARFYAEARSAARLRHPSIVGIHDVGEHRGQHYFAMEYISGRSLARRIQDGMLGVEEAVGLLVTVARAVQYLHSRGMVHRDLKPSNILIDEVGRPFVSDFGLAKLLETEDRVTASNAIIGTPGYMAPEQAAGRLRDVGPSSDIYSLGAILFECLTGRPPHDGGAPLETLVQVIEGEPPQPRTLNASISKVLERIILKCLEKQPSNRYLSAADLADDLEHYANGEPIEATRGDPWHRLRRWARREPALASRLGTMAVCGAILQINHHLVIRTQSASARPMAVVLCWAFASLIFQRLLHRLRWADLARYAWAATDALLFTLLVFVNRGLDTSLVSGYFLLVSASGLWFRERMVWLTTLLSVAGYAALAIGDGLTDRTHEAPYRHVVFATALAASGIIVAYQIRRVRALSSYYEQRPLP